MIENTNKMKDWIDNASYSKLLERWRNAPSGDPIFIGDIGIYYAKTMAKKRPSDSEHTKISKEIGWK